MKRLVFITLILASSGCGDHFLNVLPEDRIATPTFWKTKKDVDLALSGCYAVLRDVNFYGLGPALDVVTPNGFQALGGPMALISNGSIDPGLGGLVSGRWTSFYNLVSRTNYFLANYEKVELLTEPDRKRYKGEAHFLRGLAYLELAQTYGGGPIITSPITIEESRNIKRGTLEENWAQAISDFDIAIENLQAVAPEKGRATKGAALGLKFRSYLFQNNYPKVLEMVAEIDKLGIYSLFPSFEGLFKQANENNSEVIFDVQYISEPQGLGGYNYNLLLPSFVSTGGGISAPTHNLVDEFEMMDGFEADPENPYTGRDPRLGFTVILPGTYIGEYLFNTEAKNHVEQPIKEFAIRKYADILINGRPPGSNQAALNFIVLRYADVLLAKAEALIETNGDLTEAITLINRIRTDRNDVKMKPLPMTLSREEARQALRHERRVEFAFEGTHHFEDIKRWEIGPEIYPLTLANRNGVVYDVRYRNGYVLPRDKYFPIPDLEISYNPNLTQNEGW